MIFHGNVSRETLAADLLADPAGPEARLLKEK
jgi:hypothetical protein